MLGNYIRITIDPVFVSDGPETPANGTLRVISGTATETAERCKVYIFSTIALRGIVKLRVVGIMTDNATGRTSYVAAPDRVTVFEPQIRQMLSDRLDPESYSVQCLCEKSCGAVVFRRKSGNLEYLLVKNKKGGNWGFPKGHIEIGEDEHATARREVLEETGLGIQILDGFRVLSDYRPRGKIFKQVVFFIAEMPEGGEVVPQQAEIDRYIWADYSLAMRTFRFNNDRNVLTKAKHWLSTNF